jgi:RNA polymerase-binding transcription factor DksA
MATTTKKTSKTSTSTRSGSTKAAKKSTTPAAKKAPAKKAVAPAKKAATAKAATKKAAPVRKAAAAPAAADGSRDGHDALPAVRGHTKDGIAYTKDFDVKFLKAQREMLTAERKQLLGQADRLEDEANSLIEDGEMGDVQFDDESGEGDTMVVERERDLALSAQARQTVADIDAALERMAQGTYGYSMVSGRPIPRERLEAIPWATELVEEKVGGIGRR